MEFVHSGNASTLIAEGDWTIYGAASLWQSIKNQWKAERDLYVDLLQVAEIDCSGVQLLLQLQAMQRAAGKKFQLVSCSFSAEDALSLLNLTDKFGNNGTY